MEFHSTSIIDIVRQGALKRLAFVVALAGVLVAVLVAGRSVGSFMVAEDPLVAADAIFVLGGTRVQRPLEAGELYREGYAPVIVVSQEQAEDGASELARRGIHIPSSAEVSRNLLIQLGVPAEKVLLTDTMHGNTADEADTLRAMVERFGWKRVIIVTSKYHLRRAMMAMHRAVDAQPVELIGRASRFDRSAPAQWWRRRADIREIVAEFPRLVAYWVGAGNSAPQAP